MNVFGQRIHWSETGNGEPVILLHGLGSDSSEWSRVTGVLAARRRIIMLDQIGFGQSGKPAVAYRIGTLTSFLEGFWEALRLDRAAVVAHGVSGAVALEFARMHPDLIHRLVLVNSGFLLSSDGIEMLNPATRGEARQLLKRTRFAYTEQMADSLWADAMVSGAANQALIASIQSGEESMSATLATVSHPTLVIWGREDRLTPLEAGEQIHAAIPNSQMVILDRCGHSPHREQPSEFAAVVERFLSGAKVHQRFRKSRQEENVWF